MNIDKLLQVNIREKKKIGLKIKKNIFYFPDSHSVYVNPC